MQPEEINQCSDRPSTGPVGAQVSLSWHPVALAPALKQFSNLTFSSAKRLRVSARA